MKPSFRLSDLLGQTPAPVQTSLLSCKEFEVGMITGFAAGKTRGLCAKAIEHAVKYPGARILLGRKTFREMVNTVKNPFFLMAEPLHRAGWFVKPLKWDYREGTDHSRLTNSSEIIFSNLDDPVKFRNEEYSMVLVDQAEELDEELWETLIARIRWPKVPQEGWQAIAAANDNGHNWVWRRFVWFPEQHFLDPTRCTKNPFCVFNEGHLDEDGIPQIISGHLIPCSTRRFFHGTTLDNKHNLRPRYLSTLLSHPPEWQRHFIYATMEGGAGRLLPDPVVVDHFDPPAHWPRYRAIDHALNSPACCLWIAVNPGPTEYNTVPVNATYAYKEYWRGNTSVDMHVRSIRDMSAGEKFQVTVIDRSAYQMNQSRTGGIRVSVADLYVEEGLENVVPSVGDPFARVERIVLAHQKGARVSNHCKHLIETMPEYIADKNEQTGEYKILNKTKFHAVDAYGYGLMMIPIDSRPTDDEPDKPEYLRRSGIEPLQYRHDMGEWKRRVRAEEAAKEPSVFQKTDTAEFWGDEDESVFFGEFDPWGK